MDTERPDDLAPNGERPSSRLSFLFRSKDRDVYVSGLLVGKIVSGARHSIPIMLRRIGGIQKLKLNTVSLGIAAIAIIIGIGPVATFGMPQTPRETSQSTLAERLWEQAIAAKGGREALHGVRNLVVSARRDYPSRKLKKNQLHQEVLCVLPDKFWSWSDYRPDVFGLRVEMYNYETSTKYVISDGEPHRQLEPINEMDRKTRDLLWGLLPYLPETKWLKPVLVGVKAGRIGLQTVDIMETTVKGKRVDFAFDRKTHLPIRVSYYRTVNNKTYVTVIDLADYVEVGGIKLPQTMRYEDRTADKKSYQLNVEYKEDIFTKPTRIEAGPEAWKHQN